MGSKKVMVTIPNDQLRIIDGLVAQGVASTRSALLQQIITAFVSETRKMIDSRPKTVDGALEGLISYFLYSLGKTVIDDLFGGD